MELKIENYKKLKFIYYEIKNIRIDKYLTKLLIKYNFSRNFIQNLIINKKISINNKIILSKKILLKKNDEIKIIFENKKENFLKKRKIEFEIIFEDKDIIVVNKPNNLVVHPGIKNWDNTLVNGLLYLSKIQNTEKNNLRPGIVHRIDKQTTGLLLIAKNKISHDILSEQLKKRKIKRIYIALVNGVIKHKSGTINAPIVRNNNNRLKMIVNEENNSKMAITHFNVIEKFKKNTLVQCELETGRKHQIRVHFEWIKYPILNDPLYSHFKMENYNIGQYLHAKKIIFNHPKTKKRISFNSNLPDFFENKLKLLRKEKINNE